jgi:predicted  nucleic acid-binding Zn-ribbon protein
MNTLTEHLKKLVSQTSSILSELRSDTLSVEGLSSKMDVREETIHQLNTLTDDINDTVINDKDRDKISSLFDKFERMNTKIDQALKNALRESRENLTTASNKRKADDKYRVHGKPDISHF